MIALLRLFLQLQVALQVFFTGPGSTIYALQHGAILVASPVGARNVRQLEAITGYVARTGHVGAAAQVLKVGLTVGADRRLSPGGFTILVCGAGHQALDEF